MLRIIGGKFKSRLLKTPKSIHTRPTQSLVRKAFFDICMHQIMDARFLDLYAGSGAMGIEALSRGASHATFVDANKHAIWAIKENLELLDLEETATVIMKETLPALKMLKKAEQLFDIIYIDPPYDQDPFSIFQFLDENPLLADGGTIFLEERIPSKITAKKTTLHQLKWIQERKFGKTVLNQFTVLN